MSVKPPGGPTAGPPVAPDQGPEAPSASEPFQTHLDRPDEATAASGDFAAELVGRVRDGSITLEAAVDALVERAVSDPAMASLSAEQKEALRSELREVLASDPVLSSLTRAMAR